MRAGPHGGIPRHAINRPGSGGKPITEWVPPKIMTDRTNAGVARKFVNPALLPSPLWPFLGLDCRRDLLIPLCVAKESCMWRAAQARSSRRPFARFGTHNLAKNATRACKTTPNGKRASGRITKLLALDLLAAGATTGRRSGKPDHGQLVARFFFQDRRLSS
jgi:hypothetical protein